MSMRLMRTMVAPIDTATSSAETVPSAGAALSARAGLGPRPARRPGCGRRNRADGHAAPGRPGLDAAELDLAPSHVDPRDMQAGVEDEEMRQLARRAPGRDPARP